MAAFEDAENISKTEEGSEEKGSDSDATMGQEVILEENTTTVARAEITGWKLNAVVFCLSTALLLSSLETTIVATTLVTISSSFGNFDLAPWVVVAYLLTYTGFLIAFARLSDFFGRKNAILAALAVFTVFSGICGAAQSMEQLIVFRAFQGMGGSGIYAMTMVVVPEITPLPKLGLVSGVVGGVFAISSIVGPLLGGAIVSRTTWRWVFLLNVPCGVFIVGLIVLIYPRRPGSRNYFRSAMFKVDWLGLVLLLAATALLAFALQEAGTKYPWKSAPVISTLIVSVVCWVGFGFWEHILSSRSKSTEPMFPLHLVKNRVVAAALANALIIGFPYMVIIIGLPQRFQIVNGSTPIKAGLQMLPLMFTAGVASAAGGALLSKRNICWHVLAFSNSMHVIGTGLLSSIPLSEHVLARTYGYQIIHGLGVGTSIVSLMFIARVELKPTHQASIIGALTQLRILGAVIGLALATTALANFVSPRLRKILTADERYQLSQSSLYMKHLSPAKAAATRAVYNDAYNLQMKIALGFSALSLCICLFAYRRNPLSLEHAGIGEGEVVEVELERNEKT